MITGSLLSLLLLTCPALSAEPSAVVPAPAVDSMAEALPVLQMSYVDLQALKYKPGDKLEDLVVRSNGELSLVGESPSPTPIITATLSDGVAYWRLASFTPGKGWPELAAELKDAMQHNPGCGAVLDLRSNEAPQDMRGASQMMAFFAPGDNTLTRYNLKDVDLNQLLCDNLIPDSPFHGPLVVLTDKRTTGSAEVLAACLKADGALVVGTATAGRGAAFGELKLSSGKTLRFVADHVRLADGSDPWNHPVTPDIALTIDDHAEKAALMLIKDNRIDDVIGESPERHRLNEAALVQGQDPEWDAYLDSLEKKPFLLSLPVIHDTVLISALDSLKAIRLSQRTVPAQVQADASPTTPSSIQ